MTIEALFDASISGPTRNIVSVDNNSTGGPDRWLWDWGDGSTSSVQHPDPHAYSTVGNFTVTLKAWLHSHTTAGSKGSPGVSIKQISNTGVRDLETAWLFVQSLSYSTTSMQRVAYLFQRFSSSPETNSIYITVRQQFSYTPPSDPNVTSVIEATFFTPDDFANLNRSIQTTGSSIICMAQDAPWTNSYSATEMGRAPAQMSGTVTFNTDGRRGQSTIWKVWPDIVQLDGGGNAVNQEGFMAKDINIVEHHAVTDEYDEMSMSFFIGFIPPQEVFIDFVGTPLLGTSPHEVDFTDLSNVLTTFSRWDFGDGNVATFAGTTHPTNIYTTYCDLNTY